MFVVGFTTFNILMQPKTTYFPLLEPLQYRGLTLDFSTPVVMGILNVTPDSFFDGGRYQRKEDAIDRVAKMLEEGAGIIDIGGMSSRPGAEVITAKEDAERVIPVLKELVKHFPEALFSVDTVYSEVAERALNEGAFMVNDISGGSFDENMDSLVAKRNPPFVVMHMQGIPAAMQDHPDYKDVCAEVYQCLWKRVYDLGQKGASRLITDPGFGFGKTLAHNYELAAGLSAIRGIGVPVLVGISRKSMVNRLLGTRPETALNGTTALHMFLLTQGASILRVHDVEEAVQVIKVHQALTNREFES